MTGGVLAAILALAGAAAPPNGGFETGNFAGWMADPNWVVVDNGCGYYSGWAGKYWAWSGGKGEPAIGKLTSKPFRLDRDAVSLLISGWNSVQGTGTPRKWNYVTLNLADGPELDRVYAPNTTAFVRVYLDGRGHRGDRVFVQAVDDADYKTYSMLCIDDVRTSDFPSDWKAPIPRLRGLDAAKSLRFENHEISLDFSRANGSLTRVRDKVGGTDLILEPRLGGSYRFALPIPGKEPWQTLEANWIVGKEQRLTSFKIEANTLTLFWKGPLRSYLGVPYTASVTETVNLQGHRATFSLTIGNGTVYPIGEVYFPVIGGIQGLGATRLQLKTTQLVRPTSSGGAATSDVFRVFDNFSWLGDHGPEQYYPIPQSQPQPWMGLSSPKAGRSVLMAAGSMEGHRLVARLELVPSSTGAPREDGNWPRLAELRGMPVGVEMSLVDLADSRPRKRYVSTPVLLEFVKGGEKELLGAYTQWRP